MSTSVLKTLPGKLDIKRHSPSIFYILGECFFISGLPGKALRTVVDIVMLAERFNMRSLKA